MCKHCGTWCWEMQRVHIPLHLAKSSGTFSIMLGDNISMSRVDSASAEAGHSRADGLLIGNR